MSQSSNMFRGTCEHVFGNWDEIEYAFIAMLTTYEAIKIDKHALCQLVKGLVGYYVAFFAVFIKFITFACLRAKIFVTAPASMSSAI